MCITLASESPVAKKEHTCDWCGQQILIGEKYHRDRVIFEGQAMTNKFHDECFGAATHEANEDGGCYTFLPGENERPASTNHGS